MTGKILILWLFVNVRGATALFILEDDGSPVVSVFFFFLVMIVDSGGHRLLL